LLNANIVENTCSNFGLNGVSGSFTAPISNIVIARNTFNNTVGTSSLGSITAAITAPTFGNLIVDSNAVNTTTPVGNVQGIFLRMQSPSLQVAVSNNSLVSTISAGTGINLVGSLGGTTCANIVNNQISSLATTGIGIDIVAAANTTINCASISNNQILSPASATGNGMFIEGTAGTGPINIGNFTQNQAPQVSIGPNVNFVAPFSCSQ
jgi:hypothetical protein